VAGLTTGELAARTLEELRAPQWRRIAILWFALVFAADVIYAASHPPGPEAVAGLIALAASGLLLALWMAAALLRRSSASPRSPWRIDGALLLYAALHAGIAAVEWSVGPFIADWSSFWSILASAALPLLLTLPLAPWLVAVAVERPLAVSPSRFLQQADTWFPPLLVLTLVLVLPLHLGQIWTYTALFGSGRGAVMFGLLNSALATLSAMLSLSLALTAYRSVAQT
jgi:hypothetical protein